MKVKEVDRTANIAWSPQTQVPIYLARWDEDGVWYNAVIENIAEDGRIEVTFTDYGNSAIVSREDIVSHAGDIPTDQTEMRHKGALFSLCMSTVLRGELFCFLTITILCIHTMGSFAGNSLSVPNSTSLESNFVTSTQ